MLLHTAIIDRWLVWLESCPATWLADGWLLSVCIIAVCARYGQNRVICSPDNRPLESRQWLEERQWRYVRYMTVAIATDITYVLQLA